MAKRKPRAINKGMLITHGPVLVIALVITQTTAIDITRGSFIDLRLQTR